MEWVKKDGQMLSTLVSPAPIYDNKHRFKGSFAVITDVTALKEIATALKEREMQLKMKTGNLQEVNTALKVLLEKRDEDKTELEDNVMDNVRKLIVPYFEKIKKTDLDEQQQVVLNIMESNLTEIISPFSRKLSMKHLNLTRTELRIANMIKHGHITKKIAKLMNVSHRTVDTHRKNIRKKLGLDNKKANLRSYLLALDST